MCLTSGSIVGDTILRLNIEYNRCVWDTETVRDEERQTFTVSVWTLCQVLLKRDSHSPSLSTLLTESKTLSCVYQSVFSRVSIDEQIEVLSLSLD